MGALKSLGQGFMVATGIVWICNIIALLRGGDEWLAAAYLLILIMPVASLAVLKLSSSSCLNLDRVIDWRLLFFGFQGVALAFWSFDVATTFYAIDITGLAYELNPLGWPLGILGAAAFYLPTLALSYVLLFKLKGNVPLYAAIPFTIITLYMASMNLQAGAQNFQIFVQTAALSPDIRLILLTSIAALTIATPLTLRYLMTNSKASLTAKAV